MTPNIQVLLRLPSKNVGFLAWCVLHQGHEIDAVVVHIRDEQEEAAPDPSISEEES